MQYSTRKIEREINAEGLEFDKGNVYDRLCKLADLRGVNGKRYKLEPVLLIVALAKLCGEDKPQGIVEFGIASLTRRQASPEQLLDIRQPHWGIETGFHYRRDVALQKDATRMTGGRHPERQSRASGVGHLARVE